MQLTSAQLDGWATWLDLETSYAVKKFSTPEQLRYFRMGVDKGEFSWASSAAGYLHRAGQLLAIQNPDATRRMILNVGKSAHNHITCAAVSMVSWGIARSQLDAYFQVQEEWRDELNNGVRPLGIDTTTARTYGSHFEHLQALQDGNLQEEFLNALKSIALPLHAGFIALCREYEWPQPGISSTEDCIPWSAIGDSAVSTIIGSLESKPSAQEQAVL